MIHDVAVGERPRGAGRVEERLAPGLLPRGEEADHRLGLLLIDHGADARRLPAKALRVVRARDDMPAFADLLFDGQFVVSVVSPSAGRTKQLRRAFRNRPCKTAEVSVVTIPELLPLLVLEG